MRRIFVSLLILHLVVALDNGLGLTPPMGFNNWNEISSKYPPWQDGVNHSVIIGVAQAMVSTGLAAKGYRYVIPDCGYSTGKRGADGKIQVNTTLFPDGFAALSAELRAMGLKFGIYTSGGQCCSNGDDGNKGHAKSDANQLVNEWGVEYVKNDDCGSNLATFIALRDALNATGVRVYQSIHSGWTHGEDPQRGPTPGESAVLANCARTAGDIKNSWLAILDRAMRNNKWASFAGPGYFNDPDTLEIGNANVTDAEGRTHMALWCLMKAPLLIGTDLTTSTPETLRTLGNSEVIAVNQDPLGIQGELRVSTKVSQVWTGRLSGGCFAAVLVNLADGPTSIELAWEWFNITNTTLLNVRDLWEGKDLGSHSGSVKIQVQTAHDNAMLKLCPNVVRMSDLSR